MSATQADVQAALTDLSNTLSTALSDISTEVNGLEAQITALQGATSPDLSPLLTSIAAIRANIVAADPGAPIATAAVAISTAQDVPSNAVKAGAPSKT